MKKSKNFWTVLLVCISVVMVLIGGSHYVESLRRDLTNQAISNVLTVTQQQQQSFDTFISGDRERLHSFANNFAHSNSSDAGLITDKLDAFSEIDAVYTVIDLERGVYYNNKTDLTYELGSEMLEIYRSFSGTGVRNAYVGLYTQEYMFGYYECFTFADGVPGLIQKSYDSEKVSAEFSLSFYNGQGLGYVVTQEGEILLRSFERGENSFDNIFDMLLTTMRNQPNIDAIQQDFSRRETGSTMLEAEKGRYVYSYVPLQNVENWYLVSIVPLDAVTQEANEIIINSRSMLLIFIVLVAVFLTFFLLIWRNHRDIEEKDQEIEYRELQFETFSTYLSNNTDDIYMMLDCESGRVDYVSPNVERVLGISAADILADANCIAGGAVNCENLRRMKPGDSVEPMSTERINLRTQEHKWFRETGYCVSLQERSKIIVSISDRTKERQTQNTLAEALDMAQVANRAKTAFLGSVSHDIRTPMNAIMGLTVLLREEASEPERVLEYTQRIDAASHHLLGLINDVLDMNKIEGGNATLNISEFNLPEIIDEMNIIIRPQAWARQQTFKIFASSFNHEHLLGDKVRINQILINILSNAVKYTQEGGEIEMSVRELPQVMPDYSHLQFIIKDNGHGMSEEFQKVIFDPFSREQKSATEQIQGTGLGMAITKSLVELMGGTIKVESKLNEGSTFYVELELRIQEREDDDPAFWSKNGVTRMIVADDEEDVCQNVIRAMSKTGVIVHYATSGQKAVEMMRTARENGVPYDLILLDWKMPDLDGLGTARLIRKNYSNRIPIFFFTAYDWKEIEQEAMEVGVDHFLPKPFFMYNFKTAITRVMSGRQSIQPLKSSSSIVEGRHVLVVDDVEVNRMILVKILTSLGAVCDTAENGQEALDKFTASDPGGYDLILMDVRMPVMDGYGATRAIRASGRSDAEDISIIAMTANAFVDDVRDALDAGMDAHVSKPIVLDQLKDTIREVFARKVKET